MVCDMEDPSPSPWPYDACSGNPFYHVCPNEICAPEEELVQLFFSTWREEAPGLLKMTQKEFEEHVFVNQVEERELAEGKDYRSFRVDYLIVIDWVVARENHQVKIYDWEPLSADSIREALTEKASNHKKDLTFDVIPLDEVFDAFDHCHPDMTGDFCHVAWLRDFDARPWGLHIHGIAEVDRDANICMSLYLDLETGAGDCVEDVCYW